MGLTKSINMIPSTDDGEIKARTYGAALRKVARISNLVLFGYPLLLVFLVAFSISNAFALTALFSIYWILFLYIEFRRYSLESTMRGINTDFRNYVMHSPYSLSYFKLSTFAMIVFFGELIGHYISMTAYEAAALIVAIIAILSSALYSNPWMRGQLKHGRPLESDYIDTRLQEIAKIEGLSHVKMKVINGKTYKVSNAYTVGIFRPIICITDYAMENMSEDETLTLLARQVSHVKRRDSFRMFIPAFSAIVAISVMVGIVAYWSTEPGMIPYLQKVMPSMVEAWLLTASVGIVLLPHQIMWRGEIMADRLSVRYFGPDLTVESLVKNEHLNGNPVYVLFPIRYSTLARIYKIKANKK
ncbi:MAG: M48 family metalloprotease [Thermoplasmataceae archaeon]